MPHEALLNRLCVLLGGRVAEESVFGDVFDLLSETLLEKETVMADEL